MWYQIPYAMFAITYDDGNTSYTYDYRSFDGYTLFSNSDDALKTLNHELNQRPHGVLYIASQLHIDSDWISESILCILNLVSELVIYDDSRIALSIVEVLPRRLMTIEK